MKSLIFAAAAGAAVATNLDVFSTEDLEASTREFIETNDITPYSRRKLTGGGDWGDWNRYSTRSQRLNGGGSKSGKGNKGGSGGGKSGKSTGDGLWDDDTIPRPDLDMFRMLPVACPGHCVSSYTNNNFEMTNSITRCSGPLDDSQWWKVHSDGSYVMLESYDTGLCVSIDFEYGDTPGMVSKACNNGIVTLRECGADSGTQWYFTGGQLVSSMCWGAGISSAMTVFPDPDKGGKCDGAISVYGTPNDAILRSDTFMFVNRIPEAPFEVDDIVSPTMSPSVSPTEGPKKRPKTLNHDYEGYD